MSQTPTPDLLRMIQQSLDDAERAIHAHPPETIALYEGARSAFVEGQGTLLAEHPAFTAKSITLDEYKLLQRYLLAMAFVSAWYHRHSDKGQRDKTAHAAAQLVSSMGLDSEAVFRTYLDYERSWRESMQRRGIGRSAGLGCASIVIFLLVGAAAVL